MLQIEKTLTDLAMPTGLIWLGLMALAVLAWRRKQRAMQIAALLLLTLYSLAGNGELNKVLLAWLERDYVLIDPLQQGPYDVVFVLGGATETARNGLSQLQQAGDRVALGARLYHAGRTQRLAATGLENTERPNRQPNSAEETSDLWRQLGIPAEHILEVPGRNTREEMQAIRQIVTDHPEWQRLGLVTSAWHMRRAMRLAEKNELALEPLPANFLGTNIRWELHRLVIPNGDGFTKGHLACREILANLLGK